MPDKTLTITTATLCSIALAYFLILTAPIIIPALVAGIAELIKVII